MGFLGILGNLRIFGIFRDFRDFLGFFDGNMLVRLFGVITDVSTKIRMCQPTRILSANKAGICGFLKIYSKLLDGVKISRRGLVKISEN